MTQNNTGYNYKGKDINEGASSAVIKLPMQHKTTRIVCLLDCILCLWGLCTQELMAALLLIQRIIGSEQSQNRMISGLWYKLVQYCCLFIINIDEHNGDVTNLNRINFK